MAINSENQILKDYLRSNPDHFNTARAIHQSWPKISHAIFEQFLKHLCSAIEQSIRNVSEISSNVSVHWEYNDSRTWECKLWLYRNTWIKYECQPDIETKKRTAIMLEMYERDAAGWWIGVRSPCSQKMMNPKDESRRKCLSKSLELLELDLPKSSQWWLIYTEAPDSFGNWSLLVPELYEEVEQKRGEVTQYFVNRLTSIARTVIPIIDKIEPNHSQ